MADDRPGPGRTRRPPGAAEHPAGTSSGRTQSAVLVPVPEAEEVVGRWRRRYDPVATAGVPAHITLVVPWVPPWRLEEQHLVELADTLADVRPFEFALTGIGWFGRRVLWLAPRPAEPFLAMTGRLAERFATPPWSGEFAEVVPHLTVAHVPDDPSALDPVVEDLRSRLPISCHAGEVWVMSGDGRRWKVRAKVSLDG